MKINKQRCTCQVLFAISVLALVVYPETDGFINFLLYLFGVTGVYLVGKYEGIHDL